MLRCPGRRWQSVPLPPPSAWLLGSEQFHSCPAAKNTRPTPSRGKRVGNVNSFTSLGFLMNYRWERRQETKLLWQLSDFEREKPNATGQERLTEAMGTVAPCAGLPGCVGLTGALPRCFVCSPQSCYSTALGTAPSPTALFPLPPLQLPALSLLNCKTDQGDEMVQKMHPTAQTWQGEWERRLEFLDEIFPSVVAIPQRAVFNQKMEKYKTCGPTTWEVWSEYPLVDIQL